MSRELKDMTDEEIKEECCLQYGQVAENPEKGFNFPIGRDFAVSTGYPKKLIDNLPKSIVQSFCGVNYPPSFKEMKKGDTVLDIGCGAGLDLYIASTIVGSEGKVIGIDYSDKMVEKARINMKKLNVSNVKVQKTPSDKIPVDDESVDLVSSNGIYNLSPNKEAVFREAYRVLKSRGTIALSEIVLKKPLEKEIRKNIKDWFRCIGGALTEKAFLDLIRKVGFTEAVVLSRGRNARTGHKYAIFTNIIARKP
jgi:arsenite methyltransferase